MTVTAIDVQPVDFPEKEECEEGVCDFVGISHCPVQVGIDSAREFQSPENECKGKKDKECGKTI